MGFGIFREALQIALDDNKLSEKASDATYPLFLSVVLPLVFPLTELHVSFLMFIPIE